MKTNFNTKLIFLLGFILTIGVSKADDKYKVITKKDKNGYQYQIVTNDPMGVRIYTLKNGLKVYLSINKNEPRIQTFIAVKAGSTYDPSETTGLAHYLEHMMFKGTSKIATANWQEEQKLLNQISDLYEKHKAEKDPAKKKAIYSEIDSVSQIAAKYAIANEYDKMVSSLGAKSTNAHTSHEKTVYMNNIPTNELEKWLKLEKERFSKLVLRLFHTELEAVYEEFNMGQDRDNWKVYEAMLAGLFPKHPYGTQTVIGEAEHLKNPSMINIHNYWNTYYVPNNMAITMTGDLDFDNTIQLIDKYFGQFKSKEVAKIIQPIENEITKPVVKEVFGPSPANVSLAFRFKGDNTKDHKMVTLIDMLLNNSKAGLIDLDLIQKQKVLRGGCGPSFNRDYGYHRFYVYPRQGQSLDEAKDLVLAEIEKIKKGDFPDWLLGAVINDLKLSEIRSQDSPWRAYKFVDAFIRSVPWIDKVKFYDELSEITKEELVKFANEHYKNNYVIVYKRTGEDKNVVKVDKPKITPVPINRDDQSEFLQEFTKIESGSIKPEFLDFEKLIKKEKLTSGIELNYIENTTNELFSMIYIIDMGKFNNKKLPIAINYLPYLGTDKYSPSELQQEFYKLGINMRVSAGNDRSYVVISGLRESMEKGIKLLEHVLSNVKADEEIYAEYVKGILKKRIDSKKDKSTIIFSGMWDYGRYGKENPFNDILSEKELNNIKAEELTAIVKDIFAYEHYLFYYGPDKIEPVKNIVNKEHKIAKKLKPYPKAKEYKELISAKNKVYFVNYDMVQAQILMISSDEQFNKELLPEAELYAEYFGGGLSSVVFQEIRESRALAYSAMSWFAIPRKSNNHFYVNAYVATQANKLSDATNAMLELMNNMPKAEKQFEAAKKAITKKIDSERITKSMIFWTYRENADLGINYDTRKDIYEKVKNISIDEFEAFFNKHIKGKKFTFLVIGNKENLDIDILKKLGEFKELSLEEIFNH